MIHFMLPMLSVKETPDHASWLAQVWRWRHAVTSPLIVQDLRTPELLQLVDRVRGLEAQLARLKAEKGTV